MNLQETIRRILREETTYIKGVRVKISNILPINDDGQSIEDAILNIKDGLTSHSQEPPFLLKKGNKYEILDGFHRIAQKILNGEKYVISDVLIKESNMNLQESIRIILREEFNQSIRRRINFAEIDKSVKNRMVSNFKKNQNIQKSIDSTIDRVLDDIIPDDLNNEMLYHKFWHGLRSFVRQKYTDDLREYFEKRQKEVDQENNEMGYRYIFVKHDTPFLQGTNWQGFSKGFDSFDDMISKYGSWIDVDWDEVKQKLDSIKNFPGNTFTGRYNSAPLRISKAGDEGNSWGYNFSVIKSIPEENVDKVKNIQTEGE